MAICLLDGSPFFVMIDTLIKFAKKNYEAYSDIPDSFLRRMFETYKDTTLIYQDDAGNIRGFALYQDWPDRLVFILICGDSGHDQNFKAMISGRHNLPDKPICYFDEKTMRLKQCQR